MKEPIAVAKIFKVFKRNIRMLHASAVDALRKIESTAKEEGDDKVIKLTKVERKNFDAKILEINELTDCQQKDLLAEVKSSTSKLKIEIESLNRLKDAADSNSFLLE